MDTGWGGMQMPHETLINKKGHAAHEALWPVSIIPFENLVIWDFAPNGPFNQGCEGSNKKVAM